MGDRVRRDWAARSSEDVPTDPRLETAVHVSRRWYDDIFALHGLSALVTPDLWTAAGPPPRWHSAVKTLRPHVAVEAVLTAMSAHQHGSVADSFGDLDLGPHGFTLLIDATWLYREPEFQSRDALPPTWSVVTDETLLSEWNRQHDTEGVLLPTMLTHPRFTILARHDRKTLTAGAVLHDAGPAVGLSNTWSNDEEFDWDGLLGALSVVHPDRPLVDYAADDAALLTTAGFEPLGPQRVWER